MSWFKSSLSLFALSAALLASGGCGIQSGNTVMTQGTRNDPVMGTAPSTGEYALYTATGLNAIATAKVRQGDPLGFARGSDGHWIAVAGEQHFDLPHGTAQAYWKLQ
ncbi:MAG: hypothetical protein JWP03_5234 [Phycisphaerales bacterium]|jgi:hypothetical protein|nr:hypothetical protein [Phycisphaerales bacterium]